MSEPTPLPKQLLAEFAGTAALLCAVIVAARDLYTRTIPPGVPNSAVALTTTVMVILGGIVVLTDLHPLANQGHFLLSMILVTNATVLVLRSRPRPTSVGDPSPRSRWLARATVVLGVVAIVTGTVVS